MPGACFCEAVGTGTVRQAANAWSSLAFAWVGFVVLGVACADRDRATPASPAGAPAAAPANAITGGLLHSVVFALALVVVGTGSAFYHASMTFIGQFADVLGMYLIGAFVLVYNLGRLRPLPAAAAALLYAALVAVLAVLLWEVPALRRWLFAAVIVVALVLEWQVRRRHHPSMDARWLAAAAGALVAAFGTWTLDITRTACDPGGLLQGHAAWHLLGAVSSGCIHAYYRSERAGAAQPSPPA